MKRTVACLLGASFVMFASPANAQATRTWVSGVGDDVNPCSRTAPCKTFAGAISKTAPGGEINVIDPGGFGSVNITKSMVIDGLGPMSSILAVNVNGVIVNGAGITVTLRNLTINGAGSTTGNGIRIINAAAVNIDNVVMENFGGTGTNGRGVVIDTSAANVRVTVQNSRIYNANNVGIHSNPTGGSVILTVDNTTIAGGNSTGIQLRQLTNAAIENTSVTGHLNGAGVTAELTSVNASITNTQISNNSIGIFNGNGGNPTTRLYGSVITMNTSSGLTINSGTVISSGNNIIRGNGGNEVPSSTITTQ